MGDVAEELERGNTPAPTAKPGTGGGDRLGVHDPGGLGRLKSEGQRPGMAGEEPARGDARAGKSPISAQGAGLGGTQSMHSKAEPPIPYRRMAGSANGELMQFVVRHTLQVSSGDYPTSEYLGVEVGSIEADAG